MSIDNSTYFAFVIIEIMTEHVINLYVKLGKTNKPKLEIPKFRVKTKLNELLLFNIRDIRLVVPKNSENDVTHFSSNCSNSS